MFLTALLVLLAIGLALGAYAIFAPRHIAIETGPSVAHAPVPTKRSDLTETQQIDTIFAMAALDGNESTRLLIEALDDPSESVALAAAHKLVGSGRRDVLRAYADTDPDGRIQRLGETIDRMLIE